MYILNCTLRSYTLQVRCEILLLYQKQSQRTKKICRKFWQIHHSGSWKPVYLQYAWIKLHVGVLKCISLASIYTTGPHEKIWHSTPHHHHSSSGNGDITNIIFHFAPCFFFPSMYCHFIIRCLFLPFQPFSTILLLSSGANIVITNPPFSFEAHLKGLYQKFTYYWNQVLLTASWLGTF